MRFPSTVKPEICASDDATRFSLMHPHLDIRTDAAGVRTAHLVATDGHCLVAIPVVVDDTDTSGPVPADALAAARKAAPKGVDPEILCESDALVLHTGARFPRPKVERFPDWRVVVPGQDNGPVGPYRIGLNARLLAELATAMEKPSKGDAGVELVMSSNHDPIVVRRGAGVIGVIMPMRIDASAVAAWGAPPAAVTHAAIVESVEANREVDAALLADARRERDEARAHAAELAQTAHAATERARNAEAELADMRRAFDRIAVEARSFGVLA